MQMHLCNAVTITNSIEIYTNTYKLISYLDKLMILNNKILRITQNRPFCSHVNDLYIAFGPSAYSAVTCPGVQMFVS